MLFSFIFVVKFGFMKLIETFEKLSFSILKLYEFNPEYILSGTFKYNSFFF